MVLEFPVESGGNDPVATARRFCSGVVSSGGNDFEAALFSVFITLSIAPRFCCWVASQVVMPKVNQ